MPDCSGVFRRLGRFGLACALLLSGSGCSVSFGADAEAKAARNQCESSSDCGGGFCSDGKCVAAQGQIQSVMLEVTPPASVRAVASSKVLLPRVLLPTDGVLNLELPPVANVTFSLNITTPGDCIPLFAELKDGSFPVRAPDGSLPFRLTLVPTEHFLEASTQTYVAEALTTSGRSLVASLTVPPGVYDVYAEPSAQTENNDCVIAPVLQRGFTITGSDNFLLKRDQPERIELSLEWRGVKDALVGWTADILDGNVGHVISNRATLGIATNYDDYQRYTFKLSYFESMENASAEQLVRLTPPRNVDAPVLLAARSGLGIGMSNQTTRLYPLASLPTAVKVEGRVTEALSARGVPSTVTLIATKIEGIEQGVIASYSRTISTDADGAFTANLLPATYRVYAVPSGGGELAATEAEWKIASMPAFQSGKLIELTKRFEITGRAFTSNGEPAASAAVQTTAALFSAEESPNGGIESQNYALTQAIGGAVFVPRASSSVVSPNGDFTILADRGTFDVTVRHDQSSGFPWYVRPSLYVDKDRSPVQLGEISLPWPRVYRGTIGSVTPSDDAVWASVPGAQIRAFAYLTRTSSEETALATDPTSANSVVQIAETRADANGNFELLIPAKLDLE